MKYIVFTAVFAVLGLTMASVALAQPTSLQKLPPITTTTELLEKVQNITNWIFTALLIASVFIVLIAAFQFVTAGGNPETISKARQMLIWAVVGVALALLARGVPFLLQGLVTS